MSHITNQSISEHAYHIPALFSESIEALNIRPDGVYADATFGGGGHSRGILAQLGSDGRLLSFDRDPDARQNVPDGEERLIFVHGNFRYLSNFMRYHDIEELDGILADLGVSFHHFDDAERGFSFRADAPLDMRMNRRASTTAADIVNNYSEEQLETVFRTFTDLKRPKAWAKAIVNARVAKPIETTFELTAALKPCINPRQEKKELAQAFQAFRIEVNGEMEALVKFLQASIEALRPGGRLAIITYHSIEDRIVKNFMKTGNVEGVEEKDFFGRSQSPWKLVTRNPIVPSEEEIERNPRSRSAKLRVAEKL